VTKETKVGKETEKNNEGNMTEKEKKRRRKKMRCVEYRSFTLTEQPFLAILVQKVLFIGSLLIVIGFINYHVAVHNKAVCYRGHLVKLIT
jgi:hypothetical protein